MPAPHARLIISGTIGPTSTPAEIFSTGFALANATTATPVTMISDADMNALDALVAGWFSDGDTGISTQAHVTRVRYVLVDADGHYQRTEPGGPFALKDRTHVADVPGGRSSAHHPFQVSQCVTLLTLRPGRSGKGRMYLPVPVAIIDANGQIGTADRDATLNRTRTFLTAVNALTSTYAAVVSVAASDGVHWPVTSIRVGRVLDTQRKRRSALPEAFAVGTV